MNRTFPSLTRSRWRPLLWLLLLTAGCAPGSGAPGAPPAVSSDALVAAAAPATVVPTLPPTAEPTPPPPVVVTPTADLSEPVPVSAESLAPTVTPPPAASATPAPTAASTITPTPAPTFTPPALPGTSPNEHYWLYRPVPAGGTVWTDKTYPYGSTRGGTLRPHAGVEFYVPSGTPVLAAADGVVVAAGSDAAALFGPESSFYGNVIVIEHDFFYLGQPVFTLYGHLSELFVVAGQRVAAQDWIASSGATGVADGPHLHFEVRVGRNAYDSTRNPSLWLYPFQDYGTIAGRVVWPDGELATEVPVTVNRIDAPSPYRGTTSYALGEMQADEGWQENFVLDDVPAGYHEVVVQNGTRRHTVEVWVYSGQTAFVEIVLTP